MMPNITRGEDAPDLIRYLFGPGRSNEHTNQRLIAASADIVGIGGPYFEEDGQLKKLADEFDAPWLLFGTEVPGGHVWHCSLSLPPEDGQLTDEQWADVAQRFVDGMGFSDASGRAPCRWIAVHHGLSTGGNDHIHLAVDLVRADGTKADVWRDYSRAQRLSGEIERDMGLRVVEGRESGRTMPGTKRGEREAAERRGQEEPARLTLARRVRAAATVASSEAEFVRNLRASGVLTRPRYAPGGRDEVVGYSVALRTNGADAPVWYGGLKLGRDLTLPKLRQQWPGSDPAEAVAVWSTKAVSGARMANSLLRDEAAWEIAAQQIQQVREQLAAVPAGDVVQWAQTAHEASGVLAVLSARMEAHRPGPLAKAADVLARSAQRTVEHRSSPAGRPGQLKGAAMAAHYSRESAAGQVLFLLALRNTLRAIHGMHRSREELDQAQRIEDVARGELLQVQRAREAMRNSPGALPAPGVDHSRGTGPDGPERGAESGR
ncbi:relaxase/mobilization nuclease domain-containing protein [Streptomyces canus]|uniref:relaxase/mobilization nuclease domain-containing protein n=1 Tax=Streptomyces canus TaxID=58343 RepID=UPI002E268EE1